jgi:hypothetical protein
MGQQGAQEFTINSLNIMGTCFIQNLAIGIEAS